MNKEKKRLIVGVDEAGRGPLCGPLLACAYFFTKEVKESIQDAKKISGWRRQVMFDFLLEKGVFYVSCINCSYIDKTNILKATFYAFDSAISGIIRKAPFLKKAKFLIDGPYFETNLDVDYSCIVRGDQRIKEIAAASIIAKVTRDYLMYILDFLYPQWKLQEHKGYPTKTHIEILKNIGLTPFHRRSFCSCVWEI